MKFKRAQWKANKSYGYEYDAIVHFLAKFHDITMSIRTLNGNLTQTVANKEGHVRCKDDGTPLQDQTIHGTWTGMIN